MPCHAMHCYVSLASQSCHSDDAGVHLRLHPGQIHGMRHGTFCVHGHANVEAGEQFGAKPRLSVGN